MMKSVDDTATTGPYNPANGIYIWIGGQTKLGSTEKGNTLQYDDVVG